MPRVQKKSRTKPVKALAVSAVVLLGLLFWNWDRQQLEEKNSTMPEQNLSETGQPGNDQSNEPSDDPEVVVLPIKQNPDIDFSKLDQENELTRLMDQRKQSLGIGKSLDMIIQSDETFKVGKNIVYMADIIKKSHLSKNRVFEESIAASGEIAPETTAEYGVHVVQKGDNLWNIHFGILQEYYKTRQITISSTADEPGNKGYSSGLGKVLKFSETIVIIYNVREKNITTDINLLEPLSKIVVYNMKEVFSLLQEIDYDNVDKIQFDGKTIWIPAQQPNKKAIN